MPSGQSRVYRVTQLRTDGVHCGESVGTGPVNLKVVHGPINIRLSFLHPLLVRSGHVESTGGYIFELRDRLVRFFRNLVDEKEL